MNAESDIMREKIHDKQTGTRLGTWPPAYYDVTGIYRHIPPGHANKCSQRDREAFVSPNLTEGIRQYSTGPLSDLRCFVRRRNGGRQRNQPIGSTTCVTRVTSDNVNIAAEHQEPAEVSFQLLGNTSTLQISGSKSVAFVAASCVLVAASGVACDISHPDKILTIVKSSGRLRDQISYLIRMT